MKEAVATHLTMSSSQHNKQIQLLTSSCRHSEQLPNRHPAFLHSVHLRLNRVSALRQLMLLKRYLQAATALLLPKLRQQSP
jgi:hypothetical protein